jgi:hypothetical protein
MWYTYTIEYYSAIKKNEVMCFDGIVEYHIKWSKPGSERKWLHVYSYMWKIDPKGKCIQEPNMFIFIYTFIYRTFL